MDDARDHLRKLGMKIGGQSQRTDTVGEASTGLYRYRG